MALATYVGKIQNGKIELDPLLDLTDGSEVVIVPTAVTERVARRTANSFLVSDVGNLLMARNGKLIQMDSDWIWRFGIFITSLTHEPQGPIDHLDVSATTGQVIDEQLIKSRLLDYTRNNLEEHVNGCLRTN